MANVLNTTAAVMRDGFLRYIPKGKYVSSTTTANGDSTSVIDTTNLVHFPSDKFNTWWCLLTSGTYSGQCRRVSDFVQSSGDITVLSAFGGTPGSSVSFELCPFHPVDDVRQALNEAMNEVWPWLGRSMINEDLISGNWYPNGGMEDWDSASTPNKCAVVGAGATAAKETTTKLYGLSSASLVRSGADCYIHASNATWPGLLDLGGAPVKFKAWTYATVASRARLNLFVDGSSVSTSSYHAGDSNWGLLAATEVTLTNSPVSISARMEVNTGNTTAYFDHVRLIGPPTVRYLMPLSFSLAMPSELWLQRVGTEHGDNEDPCDDQWDSYGYTRVDNFRTHYDNDKGYYVVETSYPLPVGRKIRLIGREVFASMTADTDAISLEPAHLQMLYCKASEILFSKLKDWELVKYYSEKYDKMTDHVALDEPVVHLNYGRWQH